MWDTSLLLHGYTVHNHNNKKTHGPPNMAMQKQDDQHEHTFSNYMRIRDVAGVTVGADMMQK